MLKKEGIVLEDESISEEERVIRNFLVSPSRMGGELMILRGVWGVGKTHLLQHVLADLDRNKKPNSKLHHAWVSLFGVESMEEITHRLCFEQWKFFEKNSDYQPLLRDITKDIGSFLGKYTGGAGSKTIKSFALSRFKDQILCFDDLERKSEKLSVKSVIGIIDHLKNSLNAKIIIIVNDGQLEKSDIEVIEKYREKVVDITLTLQRSPQDSILLFQSELEEIDADFIKKNITKLEISNLRTIQKIIRYFKAIKPFIKELDLPYQESFIRNAIFLAWVHDNPFDDRVPSLSFVKEGRKFYQMTSASSISDSDSDESKREETWQNVLSEHSFFWDEKRDAPILGLVENGFLNTVQMTSAVENIKQTLKREGLKLQYEKAWDLFHENFHINYEDVLEGLYQGTLDALNLIEIRNIDSVINILRSCDQNDRADTLLEYVQRDIVDNKKYLSSAKEDREYLNYKDSKFRALIERSVNELEADIVNKLSIASIVERNGWNTQELDFLDQKTEEDFINFFTSVERDVHRYIEPLLGWRNTTHGDKSDVMRKIAGVVESALIKIGEKHPLQKLRLFRYRLNFSTSD
jgi:hypothetical protein